MKIITKFIRGKVYIPKKIVESIGLVEGDELEVRVYDRKTILLRLLRETPEERIQKFLNDPKEIGTTRLSRREIYEDLR